LAILVLGIGNLVMTDDGVGVRVVQRLQNDYRFPPEVTVLDGGTLGLDLLPRLEGVDRLLVVDAVETGEAPGTIVRLSGADIPIVLKTKLSPHQMGLQDLLLVAELIDCLPREMVLLGIQPEQITMGMELSPALVAQFDILVGRVLLELERWGAGSTERIRGAAGEECYSFE
jgi:hydrogenase maturation protease